LDVLADTSTMNINLTNPESGQIEQFEINPVNNPAYAGWSITIQTGKTFSINLQKGIWKAKAKDNISDEFAHSIGCSINPLSPDEIERSYDLPLRKPGASFRITNNL